MNNLYSAFCRTCTCYIYYGPHTLQFWDFIGHKKICLTKIIIDFKRLYRIGFNILVNDTNILKVIAKIYFHLLDFKILKLLPGSVKQTLRCKYGFKKCTFVLQNVQCWILHYTISFIKKANGQSIMRKVKNSCNLRRWYYVLCWVEIVQTMV